MRLRYFSTLVLYQYYLSIAQMHYFCISLKHLILLLAPLGQGQVSSCYHLVSGFHQLFTFQSTRARPLNITKSILVEMVIGRSPLNKNIQHNPI